MNSAYGKTKKVEPLFSNPPKSNWIHSKPAIFFILLIGVICLPSVWSFSIVQSNTHWRVYNSDTLHPFLLAKDMILDPSAFFSWYHPPALFLFPDLPLSIITVLSGAPGTVQPIVYAGLVLILSCLIMGLILHENQSTGAFKGIVISLVIYTFFVLLSLSGQPDDLGSISIAYLAAPYVRSGATLAALFAIWLLAKYLKTIKSFVILTIFSAFMVFSDPLFVVSFCVPSIGILVLKALTERKRKHLLPPLLMSISVIVTFYIESLVHNTRSNHAYLSSNLSYSQSFKNMVDRDVNAIISGDLLWALLYIMFVLIVIVSTRSLYKLVADKMSAQQQSQHFLNIFFMIAFVTVYLAPIILRRENNPSEVRYVLVLIAYSILWVGFIATSKWRFVELFLKSTGGRIATFTALTLTLALTHSSINKLTRPDPVISCLLEQNLDAGIAGYWNAKNLMLTSDYALHILGVFTHDGHIFRWNTNEAWFTSRVDDNQNPIFNFYLFKESEPEPTKNFTNHYGQPNEIVKCGQYTVWKYQKQMNLKGL